MTGPKLKYIRRRTQPGKGKAEGEICGNICYNKEGQSGTASWNMNRSVHCMYPDSYLSADPGRIESRKAVEKRMKNGI